MRHSIWRHILDTKIPGTTLFEASKQAALAGYKLFAFNGKIFTVSRKEGPPIDTEIPIKDIKGR